MRAILRDRPADHARLVLIIRAEVGSFPELAGAAMHALDPNGPGLLKLPRGRG